MKISELFAAMREHKYPLWLVKLPGERHRYRVLVVRQGDFEIRDITTELASMCKIHFDGGREALNLSRYGDPISDLKYFFSQKFGYEPETTVVE